MVVGVSGHLVAHGHGHGLDLLAFQRRRQPHAFGRRYARMTTERPLLDHENLDVYRVAVEFLALALEVLDGLPRQRRELRSQLERAAMSIPLNIAEGTGKPSAADRARYYATARGSALECGEALDVCALVGHGSSDHLDRGKRMLSRIVAMLTRMCR